MHCFHFPLIEKHYSLTVDRTRHHGHGEACWHAHTRQKDAENKKRITTDTRDVVKSPATQASLCHLQSSCLSEFLTYYVTAVVNDWSTIACVVLKTSAKGSAGIEEMNVNTEKPILTDMRKKYISTVSFPQRKHRHAFSQNVWNSTLNPELGCT